MTRRGLLQGLIGLLVLMWGTLGARKRSARLVKRFNVLSRPGPRLPIGPAHHLKG